MKKMTTEEKAKAYDEALEKANARYDKNPTDGYIGYANQILEEIFPVLKESEDERIRKEIIGYLNSKVATAEETELLYFKRWIAYLEKQKENHIPWYDYQKSKEAGYTIVPNEEYEQLIKQKEPHYTKRNALFDKCVENCDPAVMQRVSDEVDEMLEKEQKPADFPTTDEEVNEFLKTHSKVEVPEKYKTPDFVFSKQEYESYPIISKDTTSVKPAEWSEEDEHRRKDAIYFLESAMKHYADTSEIEKTIGWLKSLRKD